jgi:hypothetical protein
MWTKYLKIEFLTHYGNEYYCPITSVQVFGTTMLDEVKVFEEINSSPIIEEFITEEPLSELIIPAFEYQTCYPSEAESARDILNESKDSNNQESIFTKIVQRLSILEKQSSNFERISIERDKSLVELKLSIIKIVSFN